MPTVSIVSAQGRKMLAFETLWSVMVRMVSYLQDNGSFVMKSMVMVWKGRLEVLVIGYRGGCVG